MNDSTHNGYLTPVSGPVRQTPLEDVLQNAVRSICGLPGQLVRPRYQSHPARRPELHEDWAAIGITDFIGSRTERVHDSAGDGQDVITTYTDLEVLASFYGPDAWGMAVRLRDGLHIEQNRAELRRAGMAVLYVGEPRNAPDLLGAEYVQHIDLPVTVTWTTSQQYNVRNLLDAEVAVKSPGGPGCLLKTIK